MIHLTLVVASLFLASCTGKVMAPTPLVSIATHDAFFDQIKSKCGQAFEGKLIGTKPKSGAFDGRLVMHVRKCTDSQLHVPFHVGEDKSRTWIITKTGSGLSLKHDHRKPDGSDDPTTMYGGHTVDAGSENIQKFPADQYSKELFLKTGIPQSVENIWKIEVNSKIYAYSLMQKEREIRFEFDLTKSVAPPPAPWGY